MDDVWVLRFWRKAFSAGVTGLVDWCKNDKQLMRITHNCSCALFNGRPHLNRQYFLKIKCSLFTSNEIQYQLFIRFVCVKFGVSYSFGWCAFIDKKTFLFSTFSIAVSTVSVEAVLGRTAIMPCDIEPDIRDDRVYMVLWFRENAGKPLYRWVNTFPNEFCSSFFMCFSLFDHPMFIQFMRNNKYFQFTL